MLRVAFIAGPVLMLAGALAYVLGIGIIPPGLSSWVEGMLSAYGIVLFVPIYLDLSRRLAATHPRLAAVTTVTGLFGATAGFGMEFARVFEHALRQRGAGDVVWAAFYADPGWEFLSVALLGPLFPLTSLLLGMGFLRAGATTRVPSWVALSLIAAGVGFPLAQIGGFAWALTWTYPGACLLWVVSLGWLGTRQQVHGPAHPGPDVPEDLRPRAADRSSPRAPAAA